jgi:hypothetical protein
VEFPWPGTVNSTSSYFLQAESCKTRKNRDEPWSRRLTEKEQSEQELREVQGFEQVVGVLLQVPKINRHRGKISISSLQPQFWMEVLENRPFKHVLFRMLRGKNHFDTVMAMRTMGALACSNWYSWHKNGENHTWAVPDEDEDVAAGAFVWGQHYVL